ncbi:MAG: hypothetical protein GW875_08295 [Deltaproteobacteria bacterium]|nr:hypothetical protein [Deltaproteobacteria bacterium]NCP02126.1 hypothetical protein [Deltaproteobacteria bacterium]
MSSENLWCDIPDFDSIKTPSSMLYEQAEALKSMTNGRLLANVKKSQKHNMFTYELLIVVPTLANYSQKILRVSHDLTIYPATICHEQSGLDYVAASDDEFLKHLRTILSSAETRLIIAGLNAQVRLAAED